MEKYLEKLKQLKTQTLELWTGLSLNQKVLFSGLALLIVSGLLFFVISNQKPSYQVLYQDLDDKDAAAIVNKLDEAKISYRLEDNGTTILVPEEVKYSTRLKLAGENLPRGTAGFEMFQENKFGETQTDKKVKYQVALQGELARTIQTLDKVKAARVHLAIPEETLFSQKEMAPSASVAISTLEGKKLSSQEISGIINLIANSIEGLDPEQVVIIDQHGNLLSSDLTDTNNSADLVQNQIDIKSRFEREKQLAIQTMLDKTLGKDKSVVRVSAELDFSNREEKSEQYTHDPEGPFIRSENSLKESGSNTDNNPQGVPGTDSNIQQYTEVNENSGNSSYERSEKTRNYEINRSETVTRYAPGETKYDYLTASVVVDREAAARAKLGDTEEEWVSKIRNIVATACGLREDRNKEQINLEDSISVTFIDFYSQPVSGSDENDTLQKVMRYPLTPWLLVFLAVAVVSLTWFLMRKKSLAETKTESSFESIPEEEELDLEEMRERMLSPEEKESRRISKEINSLIEKNPDNAAQVLKAWLLEDQR